MDDDHRMAIADAERPGGAGGQRHQAVYDAECCRRIVLALAAKVAPC